MSDIANMVSDYLQKYCKQKDYQVEIKEESNRKRFTISNGLEKIPIVIYHTGKFVPEGSPKLKLRKEFEELKESIERDPAIMLKELKQKKSSSAKYIVLEEKRVDIVLERLKKEDGLNINFDPNPAPTQLYHCKIEAGNCNMAVTQFKNGTLLLQGKENELFDSICTIVEKILLPHEKEVALRFLSSNEKSMQEFITVYTPSILEKAETNVRTSLGNAFDFLEEYDKKYLIASECLALAKIDLPEFSPIVMPAAKAFEGFAKKVVLKIGLFPPNHFQTKGAGFSILSDLKHPNRLGLIIKEKYAGSFLDKLKNDLDMVRNFMMHSDDSDVTKVNTYDEAINKQKEICKNIEELFGYFNKSEFGGLV